MIDKNSLENKVLTLWRSFLDNDALTVDDDFFDCGGDSLLATKFLLELEKLTGKLLSVSIIYETGTVRELLREIDTMDEFIPLERGKTGEGEKITIHYLHGNLIEEYGRIATASFMELFGNDFNIHVVDPHIPHQEKVPDSIEKMAEDKLSQILEKQADGPYVILGHCSGAMVGFEIARLLLDRGKEVKAMVMVDPVIITIKKPVNSLFKILDFFMRLLCVPADWRARGLRRVYIWIFLTDSQLKDFSPRLSLFFRKRWVEKIKSIIGVSLFYRDGIKWFNKYDEILKYHMNALIRYEPLPLELPLLFVSLEYRGEAWQRITKNTSFINIYRGSHNSWKEDYSYDLSERIKAFIRR